MGGGGGGEQCSHANDSLITCMYVCMYLCTVLHTQGSLILPSGLSRYIPLTTTKPLKAPLKSILHSQASFHIELAMT